MATQAHITSRRNFLAAAAASAAVLAPSIAYAESTDQRLRELGAQFEHLKQQEDAAVLEMRPLWDAHDKQMDVWMAANPKHIDGAARAAYERICVELGMDEAEKRCRPDCWSGQMEPIAREILAIQAVSLAGLAIKAGVAKWAAFDFWKETESDSDWDKLCVRQLIDAVIASAANA